jgi:hypothetical protein
MRTLPSSCAFLAIFTLSLLVPRLAGSAQQTSSPQTGPDPDSNLASVSGQVLNSSTGEPLKKARIILTLERDNSLTPYISITDSEGRFSISGIRPGRYEMDAQRDGFLRKSSAEDKSGNSESIVSLAPGQKIADLIFRLQKAGVISGRVFDEGGDPARSVQVLAEARSTHRGKVRTGGSGSGFTNDLGEYRIPELHPGSYFVRALLGPEGGAVIGGMIIGDSILSSEGGYVPTYYPSSSDISRASRVDVQAGSEASGIDITLLRQCSLKIRGQVINEAVDHPLSTVEISVYLVSSETDSQDFGWGHRVYANPKTGEFEVAGVLAGSYRVFASLHDQQNEFDGSAPVEVVNSDLNGIRIVISRGAEIHGRVIKEGNVAASSVVQLGLSPRDPETLGDVKGEANRDGSFSLAGVADGLYDVSAFSFDTCFVKSATAGVVDILETGLVVSSGLAPSPLQIVLSSKSATVEGTVRRDDGLPVPGGTVVLVSDHPRGRHRDYDRYASTDRSGNFSIQAVEPGSYHAFAWRGVDAEDWEDPDFRQPFLPKAQAFSVSEDEKKTLQLTLLPASADTQQSNY